MARRAKPRKIRAEARRPRVRKSPKEPGGTVRDLEKRLAEALKREAAAFEQQAATAEILKVISRSAFHLQPVLKTVLENAARLCAAEWGVIFRPDGEGYRAAVVYGGSPEFNEFVARTPIPAGRGSTVDRAALEGRTVQIADVLADPEYQVTEFQRVGGFRTVLAVPMVRDGVLLGVFGLHRDEVRPFTDDQIRLVATFADQAVIAIENVRLFTELQEKNRALTQAHEQVTEALEQQTATSEILRAIAHTQTDAQPVFDTIVRSAARLCQAAMAAVFLTDGRTLYHPANYGSAIEALAAARSRYPRPLDRETVPGLAILTRSVIHVPDIEEPSALTMVRDAGRLLGFRSTVSVPMLREGEAVGTINVARREPGSFSDAEVTLLKTFANQAVIAIENVRLFTELQTSNRDLTTALEQQTATSEVLKVISRSTFDLQPVLDTLIENAARLCGAPRGVILRRDGESYHGVAFYNASPDLVDFIKRHPITAGRHSITARVAVERRTIQVADLQEDPEHRYALHDVDPIRTELGVPMFRGDDILGVIILYKLEVDPFTSKQIELVETFADQAVIAIENVRLFKELAARTGELSRSVDELTALSDVSRALSATLDLDAILQTIVTRANQLAGTDACTVYEYDDRTEEFVMRATHNLDEPVAQALRREPIRRGDGAVGRVAVTREPVQIPDIALAGAYHGALLDLLLQSGVRALLAIPLLREDHVVGGLTVNKKTPGEFAPEVVELLKTFATQSALAIQNAQLFREIGDKSRQLEAASRHKSEFLANMSHELRTPLNAVIGFSEVLKDRLFGDLNEKQEEYLQDIHASGQHLLSLINDILDLSKIEAGRMELEPTDFDLPAAIDNALTLVRERATRRGITLRRAIDDRVGVIRGDERKVKQVLLNLLSNALKFTPEGGRIEVHAGMNEGMAKISVTDTGVGIAPEDQEAIFEEFRQVGTAEKKVEGTGLGLSLARKFIEVHGGRIWVKSQVGQGSTFTFTLPVRREG